MLLLLIQGKLKNLTIKERLALGVLLRMFTRSIVLKRHVEDPQLGVESYQNKLNLTKPDMYRSDLKRKTAYTAYSNPRGFIYQNKDKKNILMRIDELYKFSDGTLNDVWSALDDILKRIRIKRPSAAGKDHMIYHMMPSLLKVFKSRDQPDTGSTKGYSLACIRSPLVYDYKRSKSKNKGIVDDYDGVITGSKQLEHQSDTQVITVKMEILLEPTSNKLMVGDLCDSILIKLVKTGKKRWSILTDSKIHIKMVMEVPGSSDEVLKLKNFKKDASLKLFKFTNQEMYEHVGPKVTSSQDGKVYKMAKRDYVDPMP
ncbi:hypothetical protein Tco_0998525 [Tanacetum coccineum]